MTPANPRIAEPIDLLADYLTEEEFAQQIGKSLRTIRQWRAFGEGPAITRVGRRIYIHREDAKTWLRSQRVEKS